MAVEQKTRADIDARWQWKLQDICADSAALEAEFRLAHEGAAQADALKGTTQFDPIKVLDAMFDAWAHAERVIAYTFMKLDENGSDPDAQALSARADALSAELQRAFAFIDPELLHMPRKSLERIVQQKPEYSEYIRALIKRKPHTLPAAQETLLASAREATDAVSSIFDMLNDVNLPFPTIKDEHGERVRLTQGRYVKFIHSTDRAVRREAFKGNMGAYAAFGDTIAATYAASVKGDVFIARARKYGSALEAALAGDELPAKVVSDLLKGIHEALPAMTRYLTLRKRTLGLKELHMYDLYVPFTKPFDVKLDYPSAFRLVLEALRPLGEDYTQALEKAYTDGWIDVYENKGKRSGAYSNSCYGVHPYVLMNYNDSLEGTLTLAHELGHAMHSYFSNKCQPFAKASYSLFVAEVASTVNEMLLIRHLLNRYDQPEAHAYLYNRLLESFRTTVFRQCLFAEFEGEAHALCEAGEALTKETLSSRYYALCKMYYGSVCHVDPAIQSEWMRIPHFYRAFYVFKYATGFSAAVALSSRILSGDAQAVQSYRTFLSLGGSVPPLEALKTAGVDMSTPAPVRDAMAVFADTVSKLEALTDSGKE